MMNALGTQGGFTGRVGLGYLNWITEDIGFCLFGYAESSADTADQPALSEGFLADFSYSRLRTHPIPGREPHFRDP